MRRNGTIASTFETWPIWDTRTAGRRIWLSNGWSAAYVQRDPGLGMMKVSRPFQKLRGDPRWQPFIEKMGLARRSL
jgi:hypothetical protein